MKTKHLIFATTLLLLTACSKNDGASTPGPLNEPKKLSSKKQLISFRFTGIENNSVTVEIPAEIDEANKAIRAEMPPGTDITNLEPEVEISGKAIYEPTGTQDFSSPINYTVTAEDGTSRTYLATVTVALSQKEILLKIAKANLRSGLDWKEDDDLSDWKEVTIDGNGVVVELNLFRSGIEVLPSEIGQLVNLQILQLGENPIGTLPPEIGQLGNLEVLSLAGLNANLFGISVNLILPKEIGQLSRLREFYLGFSGLSNLPVEIGQLSNLEVLYLNDNELSTIPQEIGQLSGLQLLNLFRNSLEVLRPEVGQLQSLTYLDLGGNGLTVLPPEIGQLQSLNILGLEDNNLSDLPSELGQLSNLSILNLKNNVLEGLGTVHIPMTPSGTLLSCESNLEKLYLEGNKVPMVLDDCICELDIDNGGTVDIDIVVKEDLNNPNPLVICQGFVIGN